MNYTALSRLIGYIAAVLLGGYMIIYGVNHGDTATVTSGIALIGVGGMAAGNTPVRVTGNHAATER